ncbi:hypothetical protein Tco_0685925 [Tanacetum coccineum]
MNIEICNEAAVDIMEQVKDCRDNPHSATTTRWGFKLRRLLLLGIWCLISHLEERSSEGSKLRHHSLAILELRRVDIKKKTENQSKMTRTEHGMEKTVLKQGQSPKIAKSVNKKISRSKRGAGTEDTIECNLNPSDGGPRESQ